jgi:hypothetical protein
MGPSFTRPILRIFTSTEGMWLRAPYSGTGNSVYTNEGDRIEKSGSTREQGNEPGMTMQVSMLDCPIDWVSRTAMTVSTNEGIIRRSPIGLRNDR